MADVTGAVVPGTTVKVSSPNLIRPQGAVTDGQGSYRFANLPPGKYSMAVEATGGFAKFEQSDVEVNFSLEFIKEMEIKTGAYEAEYGKTTGGIFNVITKSGGNEFHLYAFFYSNPQKFVRETKNFPFTGAAPNGFS